jgi:hypothetical protein
LGAGCSLEGGGLGGGELAAVQDEVSLARNRLLFGGLGLHESEVVLGGTRRLDGLAGVVDQLLSRTNGVEGVGRTALRGRGRLWGLELEGRRLLLELMAMIGSFVCLGRCPIWVMPLIS